MRIERSGAVQPLTPRLHQFFLEGLRGVCLDDVLGADERRADYSCLNGLLVIEMKTLEESPDNRIKNVTDELSKRPDWPIFFGTMPIDKLVSNMEEPDLIRQKLVERLGRAIKNHISKANKQLAAHANLFPRKNSVRLVVLVNEDHDAYDVDTVVHNVQGLLRKKENDEPYYKNIDAVVYFSEKHATVIDGLIAFPIAAIVGLPMEAAPWKHQVTEFMVARWGQWNCIPTYNTGESPPDFSTIEHIPGQISNQEAWNLQYRRNPYMQTYSKEEIRQRFDEVMCINCLAFVKTAPVKPPKSLIEWSMVTMSHLIEEMGSRGMPITECSHDPLRLAEAARRLGCPSIAVEWLKSDLGRAG